MANSPGDAAPDRLTAEGAHRRWHTVHALVTLANDVVAQALGTLLAAGLIYAGAATLGMLGRVSPARIGVVVLISGGPIALGVAAVHLLSARHQRNRGMPAMMLAMMSEKAAMGVPLTPQERAMIPLIVADLPGTGVQPDPGDRKPHEPRHS